MTLLEFICRFCYSDKSGKEIKKLSNKLNRIQPKYFTILPGKRVSVAEFSLPTIDESQNDFFIMVTFLSY